MKKLCVVGSLNADRTITVNNLPAPGETVIGIGPSVLGCGGKGGNQASAAAALGGDVALVARVGDDQLGQLMRLDLTKRGVDVDSVLVTSDTPSGTATICVDANGNNLIVVDPGANSKLTGHDVLAATVANASVLLCQLEVPMEAVLAAALRARGLVLLNPAPAYSLPNELAARLDLVVPNQNELAFLCGSDVPGDVADTVDLVARLPHDFDVIVTLGDAGAMLAIRRGPDRQVVHFPAPRVEVRDTTGAGDAFCGALAFALTDNMNLESATSFAVAAASLSTTAIGARGNLATRAEVEATRPSIHPQVLTH